MIECMFSLRSRKGGFHHIRSVLIVESNKELLDWTNELESKDSFWHVNTILIQTSDLA